MSRQLEACPVLVIGAGVMGVGIAQVAAQAGHLVMLYDAREGAATDARTRLAQSLNVLVAKGKLSESAVEQALARIVPIAAIEQAASVQLVVEAIVENLAVKRELFKQVEAVVAADCVLATNTSSISVTAIANGLRCPGRLVGMHFFNPVPLMRLVEVVSGLQTHPETAADIFDLSLKWGKSPVHARSTPGFIVNRIARPYYAETLALLQEQAAAPAVLDECLRAAGFRMGPCALMDLIGHDTNFSVTSSVYEANFYDKRFAPSLVQRELVDGGLLGRKSGQGFYDYSEESKPVIAKPFVRAEAPVAECMCVHGQGAVAERLAVTLKALGCDFSRAPGSDWIGLQVDGSQLRLTDGRSATELGAEIAVFDIPMSAVPGQPLAWAISSSASRQWAMQAATWLRALGFDERQISDAPGLVVARTLAMLVNEAADAVHQGVCTPEGADAAMKLGVNYPAGPFEWLTQWGAATLCRWLDALDTHYRGERYRVSPWLRQRAWQEARQ